MKWSWGKYICNPPLTDEQIYNIKSKKDFYEKFGTGDIPGKININGELKTIQYSVCRECCS